ncbi:hypothetical protein N7447_009468 [Penicillium robsamsonii]|uniref:uncharacterized protein n=1 Tax=Penicillium robsamsonii TaxID=1792511 RepID=UPI0025479082|nr:uncharacterized protein N7447_009468 [Penicillium robsamsonii]KAJ5817235.1 hypothetical protein N7447_009468 [Penicillium robsamsonii]
MCNDETPMGTQTQPASADGTATGRGSFVCRKSKVHSSLLGRFPTGRRENSTSGADGPQVSRVSIYSARTLTNIALAVVRDPPFASLAKDLETKGGYVDLSMLEATGWFVIDFKIDPKVSKIALIAELPNIAIAGNIVNQMFPTLKSVEVHSIITTYHPLLDGTAAPALMIDASLSVNQTSNMPMGSFDSAGMARNLVSQDLCRFEVGPVGGVSLSCLPSILDWLEPREGPRIGV